MDTKSFARVEIKDAEQGIVTAAFARFGVIDSDGDVTMKGALPDGAPIIISAYGHKSWEGALPVGKGVIRIDGDEATVEAKFFLNTTPGRDTFETVKAMGDQQEWSYSLRDVVSERGTFEGKSVRFLKSIGVHEVSPTLMGAGIGTRTLAVKSADLKFSEHIDTVMTAVDELATRASAVVTLRAEEGKSIATASTEQLARLDVALKALAAVLAPAVPPTDFAAELDIEFVKFVGTSQGVTSNA
jgi:hypothetical protein